jgi:hypothetical protein
VKVSISTIALTRLCPAKAAEHDVEAAPELVVLPDM